MWLARPPCVPSSRPETISVNDQPGKDEAGPSKPWSLTGAGRTIGRHLRLDSLIEPTAPSASSA